MAVHPPTPHARGEAGTNHELLRSSWCKSDMRRARDEAVIMCIILVMRSPAIARAEPRFKTTSHEMEYFCKSLVMLPHEEDTDPADSEYQGIFTRNAQKRDLQTCNFLAGSGSSERGMAADDG